MAITDFPESGDGSGVLVRLKKGDLIEDRSNSSSSGSSSGSGSGSDRVSDQDKAPPKASTKVGAIKATAKPGNTTTTAKSGNSTTDGYAKIGEIKDSSIELNDFFLIP